MKQLQISTEYIKLEQALKLSDVITTGGEVKAFLAGNSVVVNGETETRRGRKLYPGDSFVADGKEFQITSANQKSIIK